MAKDYTEISLWMNDKINDYINHMTGEVMVTELAEDCANHFNEDDNIPEIYYDVAVDVEIALLGNSFDNF